MIEHRREGECLRLRQPEGDEGGTGAKAKPHLSKLEEVEVVPVCCLSLLEIEILPISPSLDCHGTTQNYTFSVFDLSYITFKGTTFVV